MIRFKIDSLLEQLNAGKSEREKITKGAIAREAKVRPNVIYEMSNNATKRIEVETFNKIMGALNRLAGRFIDVSDLIEYVPDVPDNK